jgi:hypothetical protein
VREFIREWEARLDRAVQAGCHYSDAVLAFKLLEQANLEKAELELGSMFLSQKFRSPKIPA